MTDDIAREIKKLIKGYYNDPEVEPMTFGFKPLDARTRHYGIWHAEREEWWWTGNGIIFSTTSHAVALAQLQAARTQAAGLDKTRWIVRCIEEWADEQQAGG